VLSSISFRVFDHWSVMFEQWGNTNAKTSDARRCTVRDGIAYAGTGARTEYSPTERESSCANKCDLVELWEYRIRVTVRNHAGSDS
jgi:hypothetical protein